jgi:hypothetical protein
MASGTKWEYRVFWFNRVPDEWHQLPQVNRTWDRFCAMLLPWEDVVQWMNEAGQQGWEVFHVREESSSDWEDTGVLKGYAESTHRSVMGALGEIGASSPARDLSFALNTPSGYAERQPTLIFFYARRPVDVG